MFYKLTRPFRTLTFRLAMVYVGLFAVSVVVLFGFIFTFASNHLEAQTREAIRLRFEILYAEYQSGGSEALERKIEELIASDEDGIEIYMLLNAEKERVAGNLNEWPVSVPPEQAYRVKGAWIRFMIQGTRNYPGSIEVRAITYPLSKWRRLLVGQSMNNKMKVEQTISQTFWASLALTLAMALLGALIMTRSVMNRLGVINRSVDSIMHGDWKARVPYARGGDEFDELAVKLNNMLDKIEMLMGSLGQFANSIAHDLRSPLNRIVARTEAGLRELNEASHARDLLEKNVSEMNGLISTFNSILRISELEAEADVGTFERCDLALILSHVIDLYEPLALEKNIRIINELTTSLFVLGEKNLLTQAFANVVDNAVKFTPSGGHVSVTFQQNKEVTEVIIADSGAGIPEGYHDKVFEKFFRLEENRNTKGNGLGLSLVSAIARIHAAELLLEDNHPGLRVRFVFRTAPLTQGV